MNSDEKQYIAFASRISFLEFIQEEFRDANIPVDELGDEIDVLSSKKQWNIADLSEYIRQYPRSFTIFQEIFQLLRFTNAQIIHFLFDIEKLNTRNQDATLEYMVLNLKYDNEFRGCYLKEYNPKITYEMLMNKIDAHDIPYLIAIFKCSVTKYIKKVAQNPALFEKRISKKEFEDCTIRFAHYLLKNLMLNNTLESINLKTFLKYKRIPLDTKGLHGNFTKIKICKILEDNDFQNIDDILNRKGIKTLSSDLRDQLDIQMISAKKVFCTERYIKGVIKPKDETPKKFDIVILRDFKPTYVFEMNFYSTEGTKIGINQGEYIDLNNHIKEKFPGLKFYWITDGNYWLSPDGKKRYKRLLNYFEKILNINTFQDQIASFR